MPTWSTFNGPVTLIIAVEDVSWTGSVVRINLVNSHIPYSHIVTATHGPFFQTAFALQKSVTIFATPMTQSETPLVVWNNVTNLHLYRFLRAQIS